MLPAHYEIAVVWIVSVLLETTTLILKLNSTFFESSFRPDAPDHVRKCSWTRLVDYAQIAHDSRKEQDDSRLIERSVDDISEIDRLTNKIWLVCRFRSLRLSYFRLPFCLFDNL